MINVNDDAIVTYIQRLPAQVVHTGAPARMNASGARVCDLINNLTPMSVLFAS